MGYTTNFVGQFDLDRPLDDKLYNFLVKLNHTRRMKRNLPPEFGVEGELFVDGTGLCGQDVDSTVVNQNQPPDTQPSLWCQWVPTEDKLHIKWDEGEKFYHYVRWLDYIISRFIEPGGYKLNGTVTWKGESESDLGAIGVKDNIITVVSYATI